MRFSLSVLLDTFFTAIGTFALSFIAFNYFIERPFSIVFSAMLSLIATLFLSKLYIKNNANKLKQKKFREEYEQTLTQLNFSSKTENNEFFAKFFKHLGYATERKKGGLFFKEKPVAIFVCFGFFETRKADVVKIFNSLRQNDVAYILSESFTPDIQSFAKRFDNRIICVNAKTVYSALKKENFLPETKYVLKEKKQRGLSLFKNLLYKQKAKSYLSFGFVLIVMSFISPLKLYYIVFGCLFLLSSLLVKIFGLTKTEDI